MGKITQDELKRQLHYDPLVGDFTWLVSNSNRVKIGDIAGYKNNRGYIQIRINGKLYMVHRLAWLYTHGYFSEVGIDHINRVKDDNRILNLREVSQSCNLRNCNISKRNKSGITGVFWNKNSNKWNTRICVNYKDVHLGVFINKTDAVKARWEGEVKYGFPTCNTTSSAYQYLNNKKG